MKPYRFSPTETMRQTVVRRFGGADFRTHATKVSLSRSPDMKNLICEQNDFLVKRTGFQTQARFPDAIYGLFALPDNAGMVVHAGDRLYCRLTSGTQTELCSGMNESFSQSFTLRGTLYLLDGKTYRAVRRTAGGGYEAVTVQSIAFVPTTTISAPPTGGGTSYEAVNLLSARRINTFTADGVSTQFRVDATELDDTSVTATVNGVPVTVSGVNRQAGVITLATAPPASNGLATVSISFCKTVAGHADKINLCRFAGLYGGKNDTRVFVAGNKGEPNCDWQSGLYDPTYFPDNGYTRMGTDASAIMGYLKQYDSQLAVKSDDAQEASSYLRTYLMADDGTAFYPLRQGTQGAGAVSPRCFATLSDVPLFLSARGVMGVYGTAVAEQRAVRPLSDAVLPRLCKEPSLEDACAVVHEDKYYLAVGGNMYVADGSLTEEDGAPTWFYWTGIPAACLLSFDGRLYFGAADGRLCRFALQSESGAFSDDGQAIEAYWCTPMLPLSQWGNVKSIRDVIPTLMPYSRSSAIVTYENEDGIKTAFSHNMDLFSWRTVDFARFSFRCIPSAVSYRTRWRLHKTPLIAVRIGNDKVGEPFGLLAITIRWTAGRTII